MASFLAHQMMNSFHPVHGPWGQHVAAIPVFLVNLSSRHALSCLLW